VNFHFLLTAEQAGCFVQHFPIFLIKIVVKVKSETQEINTKHKPNARKEKPV